MDDILAGKRILIVDDETDILETLEEILDMCVIDTAPNFETAKRFLDKNTYDVAILDIMGVKGYELLELANKRGIHALMLTAHALSPDNLVKSIKKGARSYVPKDKISEITTYVADILKAREEGSEKEGAWLARLKPFYDKKFGPDWEKEHKDFWKDFNKKYHVTKEDLNDIM